MQIETDYIKYLSPGDKGILAVSIDITPPPPPNSF